MCRFVSPTIILLLIYAIVCNHSPAFAHHSKPTENTVKTAYIYNFAKLVEWPESAFERQDTPLILGLLGEDTMTRSLSALENKMVRGRPISIKQLPSLNAANQCHILYIAANQPHPLETILSVFRDLPCLTISSMEGFARRGGMINFIYINQKIRFEINLGATRIADLKVSSRLLKIAAIVGEKSGGNQ